MLAFTLSSCGAKNDKEVKIAVMGNPETFNNDYLEGIEQAIEDMKIEYQDSGYSFGYELFDDKGDYASGAKIIEKLCDDGGITAVIGSNNTDINKTAVHMFNQANKLFIVPYSILDSIYTNDYYDTVFSLTYSKTDIGEILRNVAVETKVKRWAVCMDDDESSMTELNGFLRPKKPVPDDHVKLVDCISFSKLEENPGKAVRLWKALGVEGVVLLTTKNRAQDLALMKSYMPGLIYIGDSSFDKSRILSEDDSSDAVMNGFIMACDFPAPPETDPEEKKKSDRLRDLFSEKHGRVPDLWYYHAYNMIRMIGDTAVRRQTTLSESIAIWLHMDGYDGVRGQYSFTDYGLRKTDIMQYIQYSADGMGYLRTIGSEGDSK